MEYTIQWIGEVFLGVASDGGRQIGMSLLEDHPVPAQFKEGDRVRITPSLKIPYEPEVETQDRAYYTVTHISTGETLIVWHEANWQLEEECGPCKRARADGSPSNLTCNTQGCRNNVNLKVARMEGK